MKKLFLTSYACKTISLINPLLPKPANQLKAAFVPTAGDPYEDKDFVYVDREALVDIGISVVDIDLKATKHKELENTLSQVDLVLVAGGNTFYLMDKIKESGFDTIVKKRIKAGLIYIGSSAGSIVCCPTIDGAKQFDDPSDAPNLTDYFGLNLFDKIIIPHAHKEKYFERIKSTTQRMEQQGYEVVTLTDDQAIIIDNQDVKLVSN